MNSFDSLNRREPLQKSQTSQPIKVGLELSQTTDRVLLVSPTQFHHLRGGSNNFNQDFGVRNWSDTYWNDLNLLAEGQFETLHDLLSSRGVEVTVHHQEKNVDHNNPGSVFPNNPLSTHRYSDGSGVLVLYPMKSSLRRLEIPQALVEVLSASDVFNYKVLDFSKESIILEGTGSLCLDRINGVAYAAASDRTERTMLERWCKEMRYEPQLFHAFWKDRTPIYHTNVIATLGTNLAVVCLEAIPDLKERDELAQQIRLSGREIVGISLDQVADFCGNGIELKGTDGPIFLLSSRAYSALTQQQIEQIEQFAEIVHTDLSTFELAGGSARCLIAELF